MCSGCVKEEYPDRDTICLENGSYFLNYVGCSECHKLDLIQVENKVRSEDDDEQETITYQHVCQSCGHVIASHEYTFRVEDGCQIYSMSCMLCGEAEDQRSIMPYDPRGIRRF